MIPQSQPKKSKNSSKVNLTISAVVHGAIILALIYFAAREGYLGKKIQTITVTKVEEKKKEPEKPKTPEKPKPETPKVEPPKTETARVEPPKATTPPPTVEAPPVVAPAAVEAPSFEFGGGRAVTSVSDPVAFYKQYLQDTLRKEWNRPEDMDDDHYAAEVQINVDKSGNLSRVVWEKGSGDARWDQTVKDLFKKVTSLPVRPPTNFPPQVVVRFDVAEEAVPVLP